jgi:1-acyl-sn-glycerol-3-phosphate acyltransferase
VTQTPFRIPWRRRLTTPILWMLLLPTRLYVEGRERVPRQGPCIFIYNHLHFIEPGAVAYVVPRFAVPLAKAETWNYPILGKLMEWYPVIPIHRGGVHMAAMRWADRLLAAQQALIIAPEGTRSSTGKLLEGKAGTVLIAQKANVPIVPVGLAGTEKALKSLLTLRRGKITARFGPAFHLPPLDPSNRQEDLRRQTDEIMCRIAVLLPESYRGYYADHPRVKELEAEGNPPPPQEIVRL